MLCVLSIPTVLLCKVWQKWCAKSKTGESEDQPKPRLFYDVWKLKNKSCIETLMAMLKMLITYFGSVIFLSPILKNTKNMSSRYLKKKKLDEV